MCAHGFLLFCEDVFYKTEQNTQSLYKMVGLEIMFDSAYVCALGSCVVGAPATHAIKREPPESAAPGDSDLYKITRTVRTSTKSIACK